MAHFEEEYSQLSSLPTKYSGTQKLLVLAIGFVIAILILFFVILGLLIKIERGGAAIRPHAESYKSLSFVSEDRDEGGEEGFGPSTKLRNRVLKRQPLFTLENRWNSSRYRYYIGDELVSWSQARMKCRQQGFEPLYVDSVEERDFLFAWLRVNDNSGIPYIPWTYVWTSGYRDQNLTNWLWESTGKSILQNLWSPGEPNNHAGNERCLTFYYDGPTTILFSDGLCSHPGRYICKLSQKVLSDN